MIVNTAICIGILAVAGLFAWLARRAMRLRNPAMRWGLAFLAAIPTVVLVGVVGIIVYGFALLYIPKPRPHISLDTTFSTERFERGQHIALTTCAACHSLNHQIPLSGGFDLSDDIPIPVGQIVTPNLTPAGDLKNWTDEDIANAIRNGVDPDGYRLIMMPSPVLRNLSDEDLASLVVFLRNQPAVENTTPPVYVSPIFAILVGLNMVDGTWTPVEGPVASVPEGPTVEYGRYVVSYQDCMPCHGADLNGTPSGLIPAPSVRAYLRNWTVEEFIQTMRTGVDPSGYAIKPPMPWQAIGKMSDTELTAIYHYVRSLDNETLHGMQQ